MEWKRIDEQPAPEFVDVLVYSETAKGYAVAQMRGGVYHNAISGQPFMPAPSHWMELPPAPSGISGYRSLSAVPS